MLKTISLIIIASLSPSAIGKIHFAKQIIEARFSITHPVIEANLLSPKQKQLVLIGEDKQKNRLLAVYNQQTDGRYKYFSEVKIPQSFLSIDRLTTKSGHKIIFHSNSQLLEYSPDNNQFLKIADVSSIYLKSKADYLSTRNFSKDINGDGLDDILIFDFKKIHLFIQQESGHFFQQSLEILPKIQQNDDSATYLEKQLYHADLNGDQKVDLITVIDDGLLIYPQNQQGAFLQQPVKIQLPINVSARNWWEIRGADGESADQSALSHRTIDKIVDINNDKVPDLLVRLSMSEGVLDRQNDYEIYSGKINNGITSFSAKPDSIIQSDGTSIELKLIDLDGDNHFELMLQSLDIGISQIIGALISGSIDQDVDIFKMDENSLFDEDSNVNKEVDLKFSLSSGKSGAPVVQVEDFNGDGLKDLMFSSGKKKLKIYLGTTRKRLFKRRPVKHKVLLPADGNYLETRDLNKDGKQDIIIRYGRQDEEALKNKVVILISQ